MPKGCTKSAARGHRSTGASLTFSPRACTTVERWLEIPATARKAVMSLHMPCVVAPCQQAQRRLRVAGQKPPAHVQHTHTDLRVERQELGQELVGRRDSNGVEALLCLVADTRHRLEILLDVCRHVVGERRGHAA
jgi:hypothetical protein